MALLHEGLGDVFLRCVSTIMVDGRPETRERERKKIKNTFYESSGKMCFLFSLPLRTVHRYDGRVGYI